MMQDIPLVHLAEGADQDDRAALLSAFRSVLGDKHSATDLHVRELLTYVLKIDRDGSGSALSYKRIGELLLCQHGTARKVVERAVHEFGLLAVYESRYVSGGQRENRYSIDWEAVRAVNSGCTIAVENTTEQPEASEPTPHEPGVLTEHPPVLSAQPPVLSAQPPVLSAQPPVLSAHPYKEYTLTSSLSNSLTTTDVDESPPDGWDVVVSELDDLGVTLALQAADGARKRGFSINDCTELIAVYRQHHSDHPQPAWLYRWFTGESRPPDPKPPPDRSHPRGDALTPEEQTRATLRTRIVQAGRAKGASEEAIAAACQRNGVQY